MNTKPNRPALAATLALLAGAAAAQQEAPSAPLRVQQVEIMDTKGFERPLVAATMMVPAGWRHQGRVDWNPGQRCGAPYAVRMAATSSDGAAQIELTPGESWVASNFPMSGSGCTNAQFADTRQYLAAWVQRHRPGARPIDYRPRPERSIAEQGGNGLSSRVDAGQMLIAYQQGGREVRETLVTSVTFVRTSMPGLNGGTMQTLQGTSNGVLAWRAPEGALDFRQFDAVWSTYRAGDEWRARINKANNEMAADNQRTGAAIGQIYADMGRENLKHQAQRGENARRTREEIYAIQNSGYQGTQATNERMHTDRIRAVREVEAYRDPRSGGVVELSMHYRHAWQLRDGSYVLTDNPSFNPQREFGMAGEQLQRTR